MVVFREATGKGVEREFRPDRNNQMESMAPANREAGSPDRSSAPTNRYAEEPGSNQGRPPIGTPQKTGMESTAAANGDTGEAGSNQGRRPMGMLFGPEGPE